MKRVSAHEQIQASNIRRVAKTHMPERNVCCNDIDELLQLTYDPDPDIRKEAIHQLCPCNIKANYEHVWDRLITMVVDEDPKVRSTVLHVLADGSPRSREQQVVQALERMQHDSDLRLRRRVRKLLAHYRSGGRINIL